MQNPTRARGTTLVIVGLIGVTMVGGALWLLLKSAAPHRTKAPATEPAGARP